MTDLRPRAKLQTQTAIDEGYSEVFAPKGRISRYSPDQPFALLDIFDGLVLTTCNPELLERLAETCVNLAADLRAAIAEQAGGTS